MLATRSGRAATALLALALLVGACSDDDSASPDTTTTSADEAPESTESGTPVVEESTRAPGISVDPRIDELIEAARQHFGDRYAGTSFARDEDDQGEPVDPEMLYVHVVDADLPADETWLRSEATAIDPAWETLVHVVNASVSMDELSRLLPIVLERMDASGVDYTLELDIAGNRIVVTAPDLDDAGRATVRDELPTGAVVFADEIEDDEDDARDTDD